MRITRSDPSGRWTRVSRGAGSVDQAGRSGMRSRWTRTNGQQRRLESSGGTRPRTPGGRHERVLELVHTRARVARRQSPRLHGVLQRDGCGARPAEDRRRQDRGRASEDREADPGLARVPGLLRQHRVVPARLAPDRGRGRARHALGGLPRDDHGRRRPPGRGAAREDGEGASRAATWRWSRARSRPAPTAPTARSAAARRSRSRARSAAAPPPRSRWAPAPRSAACRPRLPTRRERWASPTPCRASRTWSTCRRARPTSRTSRR